MSDQATPEQILQEKQKLRNELRAEYWKQVTNPHRHGTGEGGHIFDPAVQRYISTRSKQYDYFKPTARAGRYGLFLSVVPIGFYYWVMKRDRDAKEHAYRTGQVAYKDRRFKFI